MFRHIITKHHKCCKNTSLAGNLAPKEQPSYQPDMIRAKQWLRGSGKVSGLAWFLKNSGV
jgi:hypothetical protein